MMLARSALGELSTHSPRNSPCSSPTLQRAKRQKSTTSSSSLAPSFDSSGESSRPSTPPARFFERNKSVGPSQLGQLASLANVR